MYLFDTNSSTLWRKPATTYVSICNVSLMLILMAKTWSWIESQWYVFCVLIILAVINSIGLRNSQLIWQMGYVTSCRAVSRRVASCLDLSFFIFSCLVFFCRLVSCRVVTCIVVSYRIVSCCVLWRVVSCIVVSCRIMSCCVLSYRFVFSLVLPCVCRVLSCFVLSCLVLSCRFMSCHVSTKALLHSRTVRFCTALTNLLLHQRQYKQGRH